jgi:F0F1-type ATP synthase assembly protein I
MKKDNNDANKGMVFMGMGFELVIMVLAGAYLGQFIDAHFGWQGYSTAVLILVFLCSWFYHLLFMLKKINEDSPSDE